MKLSKFLKTKNGGYSLVEVMVAMVCLSLVALLLTSVISTSVRMSSQAQEYDQAIAAAKAQMNELTMRNAIVFPGTATATAIAALPMTRDVTRTINNRDFNVRSVIGQGWMPADNRPIPVVVSSWLAADPDDTKAVQVTGLIALENICDETQNVNNSPSIRSRFGPMRNLGPDNGGIAGGGAFAAVIHLDFATRAIQPVVELNGLPNEGLGRLFTVLPPDNGYELRVEGVNAGQVEVRRNREIWIDAMVVPSVTQATTFDFNVFYVNCAEANGVQNNAPYPVTNVVITFEQGDPDPDTDLLQVCFNSNGGNITPPCKTFDVAGENIILPSPGTNGTSVFSGWRTAAACGGTLVGMTGASYSTPATSITLIACWTDKEEFEVCFSPNGGNITPPCVPFDAAGETISLPNPGTHITNPAFVFGGWRTAATCGGALAGMGGANYSTPATSITLHACWTERYNVTFDCGPGNGMINRPAQQNAVTQATMPVTNPDQTDSAFVRWSLTPNGPAYNFTTTLTGDITLFAVWARKHTIQASSGGNGTIFPSGSVRVVNGNNQSFTFTPAGGYELDKVLVDGSQVTPSGNSYTFNNVTADHTIIVSFKLIGGGGVDCSNPTWTWNVGWSGTTPNIMSGGTVKYNNRLYKVTSDIWGQWVSNTQNPTNVSWGGFVDLGACGGGVITTYTIIASVNGSGGSISPSGSVAVNSGNNQTFTFTPSAGYVVDVVLVNSSPVTPGTSYTFSNVTTNHAITVSFKLSGGGVDCSNPTWTWNVGWSGTTPNIMSGGTVKYNNRLYKVTSDIWGQWVSNTQNPTNVSWGGFVDLGACQ